MDSNYPEFMAPDELELDGREGEALVNWRRKPDGRICITSFEGVSLGKDGEEEMEYEEDAPESEMSRIGREIDEAEY